MDIGSIGHSAQKGAMSMDCLPSVCYVQCCLCPWIVSLLCVMSNAAYVHGLSPFCALCPMLPMSMDCLPSVCQSMDIGNIGHNTQKVDNPWT
jgi:hypothetical protein